MPLNVGPAVGGTDAPLHRTPSNSARVGHIRDSIGGHLPCSVAPSDMSHFPGKGWTGYRRHAPQSVATMAPVDASALLGRRTNSQALSNAQMGSSFCIGMCRLVASSGGKGSRSTGSSRVGRRATARMYTAHPPGRPLFSAMSLFRLSASRTSPTMSRSGASAGLP